jgi:predicted O-methyltransferase YrrM
MMLKTTKNIAISALNPQKAKVMAKKVVTRLFGERGSMSEQDNKKWLGNVAISDKEWLSPQDAELWALAEQRYQEYLETDVARIKGNYPSEINGPGGAYSMLYFLIRKHQPEYVVETGVSLGCSSHAILTAMEENGKGELHSSDFPYFRVKDAEKYIGFVVPERLKGRWNLYLKGDADNLPAILEKVPHVDFFHYDSDKSFNGRQFAYDLVSPKMAPKSMMLFDDSNDNAHFHDLIKSEKLEERSRVVTFRGKFIGVIENH